MFFLVRKFIFDGCASRLFFIHNFLVGGGVDEVVNIAVGIGDDGVFW